MNEWVDASTVISKCCSWVSQECSALSCLPGLLVWPVHHWASCLLLSTCPSRCLWGCKISDATGSITVVNYLVPALLVRGKDLWGGETPFLGTFLFPLHPRLTSPLLPVLICQLPWLCVCVCVYTYISIYKIFPSLSYLPASQTQVISSGDKAQAGLH